MDHRHLAGPPEAGDRLPLDDPRALLDPTTYFIIVLLVVISGVHYVFQVASLMKKEEQASPSENA
jgi:hypothetical protein